MMEKELSVLLIITLVCILEVNGQPKIPAVVNRRDVGDIVYYLPALEELETCHEENNATINLTYLHG